MKTIATLFLFPLLWIQPGCGSEANPDRSAARHGGAAIHPCDLFALDDVMARFGVAAESVTVERGDVPGNETCEYSWKKPDAEAIEGRNRAALMKAMMPGGGGFDSYTHELAESKLVITFHGGGFKTQAEALQGLEQMIENLEQGISSTGGDEAYEFSARFHPSLDVAERAVWSGELRQVSAVSGKLLYHVKFHGNMDPAIDRPEAEAVARAIAAALR
jgi:hypothetical protein